MPSVYDRRRYLVQSRALRDEVKKNRSSPPLSVTEREPKAINHIAHTGLGLASTLWRGMMRGQAVERSINDPIRTFLVDDHPVVIAGARALIEASDDIICVGEAHTGADALAKIEETSPDVVVLEVLLPDMDGLVLAEQLIEGGFRGHIVVMTLYENRSYVERALQAGAKGFVQKRSAGLNLLLAIRSAMLGGLFFDRPTASEMRAPPEPETVDRISAGESELTKREEEVLRLIALGHGNKEIAYRMAVSVNPWKPTRRAPPRN